MMEEKVGHTDDAPPATWKKGDAVAESAMPDEKGGSIVARAVTINRLVGDVFACFRDFTNLPSLHGECRTDRSSR